MYCDYYKTKENYYGLIKSDNCIYCLEVYGIIVCSILVKKFEQQSHNKIKELVIKVNN